MSQPPAEITREPPSELLAFHAAHLKKVFERRRIPFLTVTFCAMIFAAVSTMFLSLRMVPLLCSEAHMSLCFVCLLFQSSFWLFPPHLCHNIIIITKKHALLTSTSWLFAEIEVRIVGIGVFTILLIATFFVYSPYRAEYEKWRVC
jgi:cellulose synthase/poly-beta-1,6-N-acetylglucosamine synthase-like glycosyltransferase